MATSAKEWKKASGIDLELPSGNVCRVKRPGMEKLLTAGILPDNMTPIAIEAVQAAQTPGKPQDHKQKAKDKPELDPEMMKKFLEEEGAIVSIFESFDKVTAMCVIEPSVAYHKRPVLDKDGNEEKDDNGKVLWEEIPLNERDDDSLYTDDIDVDDKTFIFNYVVGGSSDLEQFRDEYGDALATVSTGSDVEVPS
jgi:hypothetical protein